MRNWAKAYKLELRRKRSSTEVREDTVVKELPSKKRGRPFLLGGKINSEVQTVFRAMRDSGVVVNTSIAIVIATGVVSKCDKSLMNGGSLELMKDGAKSRMCFVERRGNTKAEVPVEHV